MRHSEALLSSGDEVFDKWVVLGDMVGVVVDGGVVVTMVSFIVLRVEFVVFDGGNCVGGEVVFNWIALW